MLTPETIDAIGDALATIIQGDTQGDCLSGQSFDYIALWQIADCDYPGYDSGFDVLTEFANIYNLTFRHNGEYCWFDAKTDENDIPTNGNSEHS